MNISSIKQTLKFKYLSNLDITKKRPFGKYQNDIQAMVKTYSKYISQSSNKVKYPYAVAIDLYSFVNYVKGVQDMLGKADLGSLVKEHYDLLVQPTDEQIYRANKCVEAAPVPTGEPKIVNEEARQLLTALSELGSSKDDKVFIPKLDRYCRFLSKIDLEHPSIYDYFTCNKDHFSLLYEAYQAQLILSSY